jgi:hypothetical protein
MKKMTDKAIDTMKKMSMAGPRQSSVNSKKSTVQSTPRQREYVSPYG